MSSLAASFTVTGLHGALTVLAFLAFLFAAVLAWFAPPRSYWGTFVAAGLALVTLASVVSG